ALAHTRDGLAGARAATSLYSKPGLWDHHFPCFTRWTSLLSWDVEAGSLHPVGGELSPCAEHTRRSQACRQSAGSRKRLPVAFPRCRLAAHVLVLRPARARADLPVGSRLRALHAVLPFRFARPNVIHAGLQGAL